MSSYVVPGRLRRGHRHRRYTKHRRRIHSQQAWETTGSQQHTLQAHSATHSVALLSIRAKDQASQTQGQGGVVSGLGGGRDKQGRAG